MKHQQQGVLATMAPAELEQAQAQAHEEDVSATVLAIRATGGSFLDVLRALTETFPAEALSNHPKLLEWAIRSIQNEADEPHPFDSRDTRLSLLLTAMLECLPGLGNAAFGACTGLVIKRRLDLSGCANLKTLPENLWLKGNRGCLALAKCTNLVSLPSGLRSGGNLWLAGCTALKALPEDLRVKATLDVRGCTSLERLPDNLCCHDLSLDGCTSMRSLPRGLKVKQILTLGNSGNNYVDRTPIRLPIPEDTQVDGFICVGKECWTLPEWRTKFGFDSGYSPAVP